MIELAVCIVFFILGMIIGYFLQPKTIIQEPTDLDKKVEKLEQELITYKNLKESLLNDVRYWRSKVEKWDS